MPENTARLCVDRIVPVEYAQIAREKAIVENPANASPFEAAAVRSKLWRPGRTLRVTFLDGVPEVQGKSRSTPSSGAITPTLSSTSAAIPMPRYASRFNRAVRGPRWAPTRWSRRCSPRTSRR